MVMTKNESPRIYVASLSDYNNGLLHGVWIDAAQDADSIRDEINAMLMESKYPNVMVDCPDCDDNAEDVPDDYPVKELSDSDHSGCRATCGDCGRSWDDAIVTSMTPAPAARCPFESFHNHCETCNGTGKVPSAEEWAIHDYEGFGEIKISEHEDIDDIAELAEAIEEHGEAYAAYVDVVGAHYATPEGFQDAYRGEWDSEKSFAMDWHEELGTELGELADYIDWDAVARDLFINGFTFKDGYVFEDC